jgi:hypothetical protein
MISGMQYKKENKKKVFGIIDETDELSLHVLFSYL